MLQDFGMPARDSRCSLLLRQATEDVATFRNRRICLVGPTSPNRTGPQLACNETVASTSLCTAQCVSATMRQVGSDGARRRWLGGHHKFNIRRLACDELKGVPGFRLDRAPGLLRVRGPQSWELHAESLPCDHTGVEIAGTAADRILVQIMMRPSKSAQKFI